MKLWKGVSLYLQSKTNMLSFWMKSGWNMIFTCLASASAVCWIIAKNDTSNIILYTARLNCTAIFSWWSFLSMEWLNPISVKFDQMLSKFSHLFACCWLSPKSEVMSVWQKVALAAIPSSPAGAAKAGRKEHRWSWSGAISPPSPRSVERLRRR